MKIQLQPREFLIAATFAGLACIGTICLSLPTVRHLDTFSFIDALFTAVSATCVTGLITVPTSGFNISGQWMILILMQLGGIGIMTITTSLILLLRNELNLKRRLMVTDLAYSPSLHTVDGVLITVVAFTFICEGCGAFLLYIGFSNQGFPPGTALYHAVFHSVSAFCNAGFSTFDQSLIDSNVLIKTVIMSLIILGGIGYYVIYDCLIYFRTKGRLTLHTRLVLQGTVITILLGGILLLGLERGDLPMIDALFQSVTARTAGFNTVDIASLRHESIFILIFLMIIGAAPGSTGGGIKLTTFILCMLFVYNVLRGRTNLVIYGRQIPRENIDRALSLFFLYLVCLCAGTLCLLCFESHGFLPSLFEMTSAIGTVGLSMGITAQMSVAGKLVLIAGMFMGRVGPAMLIMMLIRDVKSDVLRYPEEKIILG